MSTVKTGWLKNNNGEKFAPKTLTSQVLTDEGITLESQLSVDLDAALAEAKAYTDTMTSGIASTGVVDNKINAHNTSESAHSDIRNLVNELSTKVNNFLDVDDATTDQLSEVLTLINNNKGTLDSITSSKVNVSDIVDNLTTSSETKVLSAKQGVALKALIDALQEVVNGKAATVHSHAISDVTNLQSTLNEKASKTSLDGHTGDAVAHISAGERTKWNEAKAHADSDHAPVEAQANVIESIKVNGTAQTITGKAVNITVPTTAADIGASPSTHNHDSDYDAKGAASAVQTNLNTLDDKVDDHLDDTDSHVTAQKKTNWDTAYSHSQSTHARTDATKVAKSNTNGNILINGTETTVYTHPSGTNPHGTTKSDVGLGNVDNTSDANKPVSTAQAAAIKVVQDEVTAHTGSSDIHFTPAERAKLAGIADNANKYSHPNSGVKTGTYRSVTVDAQGHVTGGTNPTTISGYGITDAFTKTEVNSALSKKSDSGHGHDAATTSANGFMTSAMVTKLNGITDNATRVIVDSNLSATSTNAIENKAVNSAIATATSAISANTNSIVALEEALAGIQEVTSAEIQTLFSK